MLGIGMTTQTGFKRFLPTFSFGSCLRWMRALKEKAAPKEKGPHPARQEKQGRYAGRIHRD